MKARHIDHIGINVDNLPEAKAFFQSFGFEIQAEWDSEGSQLDTVIGLRGSKTTACFLTAPGGGAKIELVKFHAPVDANGIQPNPANTLGIRHIAILVDDLEAVAAAVSNNDLRPFSDIQIYPGMYKTVYFNGPEGIILELAEEIGN